MSPVLALILGILIGAALVVGAMLWVLRTRMIATHRSERSFADTCAAIEQVVPDAPGWGFPLATWDFYRTFEQKNLVPRGFRQLKVYFVCNAGLASNLLASEPQMAGMMPCSWAVAERSDGSVHVSKLNVGLMGRMFSGVIRRTMGQVAAADDAFLAQVLSPAPRPSGTADHGAAAPRQVRQEG